MKYNIGDKVSYRTVISGTVKGIVTAIEWDSFFGYTRVEFKVTSRGNRTYPQGFVTSAPETTVFLSKR